MELGSSDDRRPAAGSAAALAKLVGAMCVGCWAVGGAVNAAKLKAYHVVLREGQLRYTSGGVDTILGPVPYDFSGLQFVKIPLLMGELPKDRIASVSHRLSRIIHAVQRLRPSYSLVRRILLAFGVSPLDYLTEAMPIPGDAVGGCQLLVDRIATMTLGIPRSALKCALYCPVAAGGFGVPHLRTRSQLRFMESMCWALNSRNTLVAQALRWFVDHPAALPVRNNDIAALQDIQQAFGLRLATVTDGASAKVGITYRRGYTHGPVVLVSDGSATDHAIS